jgi:diguanylate cyclase (GGDEF)-like protein
MRPLIRSIKGQLLLLVLAAMLPGLSIIVAQGWHHSRNDLKLAHLNQIRLTQTIIFQHEAQVNSLHQLLVSLARLPEIQHLDVAASNNIFKGLLELNHGIQNISLIRTDGLIISAGTALSRSPAYATDRKYFRDAIQSGKFSVGEYEPPAITGQPMLNFSLPVRNAKNDRVVGILAASINFKILESLCRKLELPDQVALNISDHNGILLYRFPGSNKVVPGTADNKGLREKVAGAEEQGSFFAVGRDGVQRLLAFKRLRLYDGAPPYIYIRVSVPQAQVMQAVNQEVHHALFLLAFGAALALLVTWFLGDKIIVRRLHRLEDVAKLVSRGELRIQTGIPHDISEIGQLAASFDIMTEKLVDYEAQHRKLELKLRGFAITDELTGLYNRRGFFMLAELRFKQARRTEAKLELVYADLDGMKTINDSFGHNEGDQALIATARILCSVVRSSDIVARLGGDEFVILADMVEEHKDDAIIPRLKEYLLVYNQEAIAPYKLSISFGSACYDPAHPCTVEELLTIGDNRMYEKKRLQREKVCQATLTGQCRNSRGNLQTIPLCSVKGCAEDGVRPLMNEENFSTNLQERNP